MSDNFKHNLLAVLEDLGLSRRQAKIYLACFNHGPISVTKLASVTKEKKSTVFDTVKFLTEKKFFTTTLKGKRKLYIAEDPDTIKYSFQEKLAQFENLIPILHSNKAIATAESFVKYYKERDGLRQIFEEMLAYKTHAYIGSLAHVRDVLGSRYYLNWVKRRINRGIYVKALRVKSGEIKNEILQNEEDGLREIRYLPNDLMLGSALMLYEHKIAFISTTKETFGFVVESVEYANTISNIFDLLWKGASVLHE